MSRPKITRKKMERKSMTRISREARSLDFMFEPGPNYDPLADVEYGNGLEADAAAETKALSETFSGRAKLEAQRFELATDSEFWFAVYFQSREQKEAFLRAMGWLDESDKYLNGHALAEMQGIDIGKVDLPKPKGVNRRMKRLAREL